MGEHLMVLIIKPELNFLRWFDFSETMKVILIFFINHVAEKKSEEKSHREKRKEARLEKKAKKYQAGKRICGCFIAFFSAIFIFIFDFFLWNQRQFMRVFILLCNVNFLLIGISEA